MKTPLFFGTTLRWDVTLNAQLKSLSSLRFWDRGLQEYVYIFSIDKLPQFQALVRTVEFKEEELLMVHRHMTAEVEDVQLQAWKGKSGYTVITFPKIYRVISYQRANKGAKPRKVQHDVPRERVVRLWKNVISRLPRDQPHRFAQVAARVCKEFELDRFFKDTGTFQKDKFQGSRGDGYFPFYYYPMKVLQYLQLVVYEGQYVTRVSDAWDEQAEFSIDIKGGFASEEDYER